MTTWQRLAHWSRYRSRSPGPRRIQMTLASAALLLVIYCSWHVGSSVTNGTIAPSPSGTITYGPPKVVTETVNIPDKFKIVMNTGDTPVAHKINESFPMARSASVSCVPRNPSCVFQPSERPGILNGTCSADGLSCVLRRTVDTAVVMTVTDVTKCTESELTAIAETLHREFPITDGKHAVGNHDCVRFVESRTYPAGL